MIIEMQQDKMQQDKLIVNSNFGIAHDTRLVVSYKEIKEYAKTHLMMQYDKMGKNHVSGSLFMAFNHNDVLLTNEPVSRIAARTEVYNYEYQTGNRGSSLCTIEEWEEDCEEDFNHWQSDRRRVNFIKWGELIRRLERPARGEVVDLDIQFLHEHWYLDDFSYHSDETDVNAFYLNMNVRECNSVYETNEIQIRFEKSLGGNMQFTVSAFGCDGTEPELARHRFESFNDLILPLQFEIGNHI